MSHRILVLLFAFFVAAANAATDSGEVPSQTLPAEIIPAIEQSAKLPAEATGAQLTEAKQQVETLLGRTLTPALLLPISLLQSPELQADLVDLGVNSRDLLQAGLNISADLPAEPSQSAPTAADQAMLQLDSKVLDTLLHTAAGQLATDDLARLRAEASERLFRDLHEKIRLYYSAVISQEKSDLLEQSAVAAETSAELAKRYFDAGNMPELEYLQQAAEASRYRLAAEAGKLRALQGKADLASRLGIENGGRLQLPTDLPLPPHESLDAAALLSQAKSQRPPTQTRVDINPAALSNDIGVALATLDTAKQQVTILDSQLLPQRKRITELSKQNNNYMLTGIFAALTAKRDEYETSLDRVEALGTYWQSRAELALTLRSDLPLPTAAAPEQPTTSAPEKADTMPAAQPATNPAPTPATN